MLGGSSVQGMIRGSVSRWLPRLGQDILTTARRRVRLLFPNGVAELDGTLYMNLIHTLFGSKHQRDCKRLRPLVSRINAIGGGIPENSRTRRWSPRRPSSVDRFAHGATLDDSPARGICGGEERLPPSVRHSAHGLRPRTDLEMIPFDVQLMAASCFTGKISEMQTGQGKDPCGHPRP